MHNYRKIAEDFRTFLEEREKQLSSDEERIVRRIEAIMMVESNPALLELIADINDYHCKMDKEAYTAIAKWFSGDEFEMTWDDVWDIVYPEVYEDKECEGELWMNGISIDVREGHTSEHRHFALSTTRLAECVASFFGE